MATRRPTRTEGEPADTRIGPVLKQLRMRSGMSLRTLAARAGFSASFLSLLEKGQVSPSIVSLERIARTLGVTLADLFQVTAASSAGVVRARTRPAFTSSWSRARIESLTVGGDEGKLEALAVTLEASGTSGAHAAPHPRHQFAYVLKGSLTLQRGAERLVLRTGDAVTIPAGTPYRWENVGRRSAQALLVFGGR